jgi:hypothetical protein
MPKRLRFFRPALPLSDDSPRDAEWRNDLFQPGRAPSLDIRTVELGCGQRLFFA